MAGHTTSLSAWTALGLLLLACCSPGKPSDGLDKQAHGREPGKRDSTRTAKKLLHKPDYSRNHALRVRRVGHALNHPPDIAEMQVTIDTLRKKLTVVYNLFDPENEPVTVGFRVSTDDGATFLTNTGSARGDVGKAVKPGLRKEITWNYPNAIRNPHHCIVKLIADDHYPVRVQDLADQVDTANLAELVRAMEGIRNHKAGQGHLEKVRRSILDKFRAGSLHTYTQDVPYGAYTGQNIIGKLPGGAGEGDVYLLSAHYDTVEDSPGADDNASGVAGMLEAMRILSACNFKSSIGFIGFDLEEFAKRGSYHYVYRGGIDSTEHVKGVINLDMIGFFSERPNSQPFPKDLVAFWPDVYRRITTGGNKGNFILSVANQQSAALGAKLDSCAGKYAPHANVVSITVPNHRVATKYFFASDHANFWTAGYSALSVGDTGGLRNTHYHSPSDRAPTINYAAMAQVVKAIVATVAEAAGVAHSTTAYGVAQPAGIAAP